MKSSSELDSDLSLCANLCNFCSIHQLIVNLTRTHLQVIPRNDNTADVARLEISRNMITLNKTDQEALETYPSLEELYLDSNMVTSVAAHSFSKLPNLRLLSLSRNNISR